MSFKSEPKPLEVKALKNYLIYIRFENGEEKIYDMKEDLEYPFFRNLKDIEKFKRIKIYIIYHGIVVFSIFFV